MLSNCSYQLIETLSLLLNIPVSSLLELWETTQTAYFQTKWDIQKQQHKHHSMNEITELTQDVIIRYGSELDASKSKLALFYVDSLIQPKDGRSYHKDLSDWEWSRPNLASDLKEYLRDDTYRLVLLSNEILSWKVQMIMHVAQEVLPPNGKLTILIAVHHSFPQSTLFESAYPQMKWADAIVVGKDDTDTYLGHLLGMSHCLSSSYQSEPKSEQ